MNLSLRQRLEYCSHLGKAVFRHRIPFYDVVLAAEVGRGDIILDIGANAGQFAKAFAALAPEGQVHAFEPGLYARQMLKKVVRWRRLANVTVLPFGLAAEDGAAVLEMPVKYTGALRFSLSHVRSGGTDSARAGNVVTEKIELRTVDGYVRDAGLPRVDFIKCDVEGFEHEVLRGAVETIERERPKILLEVVDASLARAGATGSDIWNFLVRDRGYRAHPLRADGLDPPAPAFERNWDYLLLPGAPPAES